MESEFMWLRMKPYPDGMRRFRLTHKPCGERVFQGGHMGRPVDVRYFYDAANKSAEAHLAQCAPPAPGAEGRAHE